MNHESPGGVGEAGMAEWTQLLLSQGGEEHGLEPRDPGPALGRRGRTPGDGQGQSLPGDL